LNFQIAYMKRTPEKMVGNWMRLDGEKFREATARDKIAGCGDVESQL
jgi:hypothetical protein